MPFAVNEIVHYRAIAGDGWYRAKVVKIHESGSLGQYQLDLDIEIPGNEEPFKTTRVPIERCRHIAAYGPPFTTDVP